ncbi:MAG: alcohol dehydrogenase catalytic domain-containing protein [Proteobacteria bacterium]|nr:alcohol dehydrogenase catalytic domain-containing protein [Pseudomonadota bacterium]
MSKTMKQVIMQGPGEALVVAEGQVPAPGKGQLLLRVRACGICGSDLHWVQLGLARPGTVLGHEFSGEVVEVGEGGEADWKPGDRVTGYPVMTCGECPACMAGDVKACPKAKGLGLGSRKAQGAYAEYVVVNANVSVKIPDTVSWEEAACIEPFSVGLYAVKQAGIRPGQNVLVVGAGPIGLAAASWSRFSGAGSVLVSERSAHRMKLALQMGADAVIDAATEQDAGEAFFRETGTRPDLIIEAVGAPGLIQHCIEMAPKGGRILVVGACMEKDVILPGMAISKDLELRFVVGYELRDFKFALEMTGQGRIKPGTMITHRVFLDGLPAAFEALKTPADQCKVMILP